MNINNRKFIMAYINNPMMFEDIIMLYNENNIVIEKCDLYNDFIQSLIMLIFDTYLGDDVTNKADQINHFNWCWNKNLSNFKEEGLLFDNDRLFNYYLEFMLEVFYCMDKKSLMYDGKAIPKLWFDIFDYNKPKTNSDIDFLIEIYIIFEKSLKLV